MTRTASQENTTARAGPSPVRPGEAEPFPSCRNEGHSRPVIPPHRSASVSEGSGPTDALLPNETLGSQASVRTTQEAASQPRVGSDFLGFHLLDVLGRGAFGTVYLARQGDLADRLVVLKISSRRDEEPRLLAQLQHTNIVPIYSTHSAQSLQVVCMPFFGTTTLQDVSDDLKSKVMLPETGLGLVSSLIDNRLEQKSRLTPRSENEGDPPSGDTNQNNIPGESQRPQPPPSDETLKYLKGLTYVQAVLWVGSRLASGLAHAHERKILHLDLKPANILLTDEGQPMLLDLNLSVDLKQGTSLASFGGTALYMSPEQLEALQSKTWTVDGRSDIYSLGIILFELLTRRRTLEVTKGPAGEIVAGLLASRKAPCPPVRCWNKAVSPAVESMIRHCLEPDPARRYQDANQLQEDIDRHLSNYPLKHAREPSLLERAAKWRRRHPSLTSTTTMAIVAVLSVVLVCSARWVALRDSRRARASLNYLKFHENFEKSQLLLNTVHDGSKDHLIRGLSLARSTMVPYLDDEGGLMASSLIFEELPGAEQDALRSELAELILLEVRARVALINQSEPEARRRQVYQWGIERLEQARTIDRQLPAAFYHDRARLLSALGRKDAAAKDRSRAGQMTLRSARDHYLLGTFLLALHQPDRAEVSLSRAVALNPRQFWTWFALGICHSDQGRHSDAAADFGACTILVPQLAWPYLNRGLALSRSGRLTEAAAAYDHALELDDEFAEAWVDRGLALLELGHPEQALVDLERAIALNVRAPSVLASHAEALARVGRHADAETSFSEAIRSSPSDPTLVVARGFSRLGRDQTGAAADFSRALELDPKCARAYLGRAHLVRTQNQRAALAQVERALSIDPDFGDALQLRALIRARMDDPGAESDVERILRVPTPQRLYNAACAMSLLTRGKSRPKCTSLALIYLQRAKEAGLLLDRIAEDPDLAPLKNTPEFARLLASTRKTGK
jgi:eukaryotic-like serine/threonine-protein kinase